MSQEPKDADIVYRSLSKLPSVEQKIDALKNKKHSPLSPRYLTAAINIRNFMKTLNILEKDLKKELVSNYGYDKSEFGRFIRGFIRPSDEVIELMAKKFQSKKCDIQRIIRWYDECEQRNKNKQLLVGEGPHKYSHVWAKFMSGFESEYKRVFETDEIPQQVESVLKNIENDVYKITRLPVLAFPLFQIFIALYEDENWENIECIHQIQAAGGHENLAVYMECYPHLGTFFRFVANKIMFKKNPKRSLHECFATMTKNQFKDLLHITLMGTGLYGFAEDLDKLINFHEFNSFGIVAAKYLKRKLNAKFPRSVKYDSLVMALGLQYNGMHAMCSILRPSTSKNFNNKLNQNKMRTRPSYQRISEDELSLIYSHFHPVICGIIADIWGYSEDVVHLLFEHHSDNIGEVSQTCAMLKLINELGNAKFNLSKNDIRKLLVKYHFTDLDEQEVYDVLVEINNIKESVIESSTSLAEEYIPLVKKVLINKANKTIEDNILPNGMAKLDHIPKASDYYLDPDVQMVHTISCHEMVNRFNSDINSQRAGEAFEEYENRMGSYRAIIEYLFNDDPQTAAKNLNIKLENYLKRIDRFQE